VEVTLSFERPHRLAQPFRHHLLELDWVVLAGTEGRFPLSTTIRTSRQSAQS
jgi:hypothetical protein